MNKLDIKAIAIPSVIAAKNTPKKHCHESSTLSYQLSNW